jgi:hypothetical protein
LILYVLLLNTHSYSDLFFHLKFQDSTVEKTFYKVKKFEHSTVEKTFYKVEKFEHSTIEKTFCQVRKFVDSPILQFLRGISSVNQSSVHYANRPLLLSGVGFVRCYFQAWNSSAARPKGCLPVAYCLLPIGTFGGTTAATGCTLVRVLGIINEMSKNEMSKNENFV